MSERLKEFRARRQPREIVISDGTTFLVRPVRLESLVFNGTIPLTTFKDMQAAVPDEKGEYAAEDVIKIAPALNAVAIAAVIDPPVRAVGDENVLGVDELEFADKVLIFTEANRRVAAMSTFPGKQDGSGDAVPGE